jgi:sec-independent protein translocase protein TatA
MIGRLGMPELLVIMFLCLLIFGPKALPSLGKSVGDGLRSLKKGLHAGPADVDDEDEIEIERRVQERVAAGKSEPK